MQLQYCEDKETLLGKYEQLHKENENLKQEYEKQLRSIKNMEKEIQSVFNES